MLTSNVCYKGKSGRQSVVMDAKSWKEHEETVKKMQEENKSKVFDDGDSDSDEETKVGALTVSHASRSQMISHVSYIISDNQSHWDRKSGNNMKQNLEKKPKS